MDSESLPREAFLKGRLSTVDLLVLSSLALLDLSPSVRVLYAFRTKFRAPQEPCHFFVWNHFFLLFSSFFSADPTHIYIGATTFCQRANMPTCQRAISVEIFYIYYLPNLHIKSNPVPIHFPNSSSFLFIKIICVCWQIGKLTKWLVDKINSLQNG